MIFSNISTGQMLSSPNAEEPTDDPMVIDTELAPVTLTPPTKTSTEVRMDDDDDMDGLYGPPVECFPDHADTTAPKSVLTSSQPQPQSQRRLQPPERQPQPRPRSQMPHLDLLIERNCDSWFSTATKGTARRIRKAQAKSLESTEYAKERNLLNFTCFSVHTGLLALGGS
jgi:hypothetical protein